MVFWNLVMESPNAQSPPPVWDLSQIVAVTGTMLLWWSAWMCMPVRDLSQIRTVTSTMHPSWWFPESGGYEFVDSYWVWFLQSGPTWLQLWKMKQKESPAMDITRSQGNQNFGTGGEEFKNYSRDKSRRFENSIGPFQRRSMTKKFIFQCCSVHFCGDDVIKLFLLHYSRTFL